MKEKFCLCLMALATVFSLEKNFCSLDKNNSLDNDLSEIDNATSNSDIATNNKGRYNRPTTIFDDDASTGNYGEYHTENKEEYKDGYYICTAEDRKDDAKTNPIALAFPKNEHGKPENYKTYVSSSLDYYYDKEDWYSFCLMGDSVVTIKITNKSNFDLDYFVYSCNTNTLEPEKSCINFEHANEDYSVRNFNLVSGVYLIHTKFWGDDCNTKIDYDLCLKVDYKVYSYVTTNYRSVRELCDRYNAKYQKQLGGVVWMSDYDPFGYKLLSNFGNQKIASGGVCERNFYQYVEGKEINQAIIYAFTYETRRSLMHFFDELKEAIYKEYHDYLDNKKALKCIVTGTETVINDGIEFVKIILKIAGKTVPIWLKVTEAVVSILADALIDHLFPIEKAIDLAEMYSWLCGAAGALSCLDKKGETEDVVRIPLSYKVKINGGVYCNFVPKVPKDSSEWKTDWNEPISYFPNNSYFCGKLYPLFAGGELSDAINHSENELNIDGFVEVDNEDSWDFDKNGIYEYDLVPNQKAVCDLEFSNGGNVILQTFSDKKTRIEVFDYFDTLEQIDVKPLIVKSWDLNGNNAYVCFTPEIGKEYKVVAYFDEQYEENGIKYETGGGKLRIGVTNCSRKVNSFNELVLLKNAEGKGTSSSSIPYISEPYCETGRILCTKTSTYKLNIGLTGKYEIYNASIAIADISGEEAPNYYTLRGDKKGNVSTVVSLQEGKKYYFVISGNSYLSIPSTLISSIYWNITMTEGDDSNTESEEEMYDKIFGRHNKGNKNRDFFF